MSAVTVIYKGHAPAVTGGGFLFERGKPVEVPAEMANTLGSAFQITTRKKGEGK